MTTVIGRLNTDHANMLRLLDILDRQLGVVEDAGKADFELMRDIMYYLSHYADAIHHPMEDIMYARLAERSPRARTDLARIPEQHDRIKADGGRLLESLTMIADGGMTLRTGLVDEGRAYTAGLRMHIDMEEQHLFPLAETVLDAEDLVEVERTFDENQDPVFGVVVSNDFENLYRHIREQAG